MIDLVAGTTTLVSERAGGGDSGNGASSEGSFSPDGMQVVFTSVASDLVPGDTNEESDVFVRDLTTGTTSVVSAGEGGSDTAVAGSRRGVFASDGEVLFESLAWNLGPTDTNDDWDLYIRNLDAGITSLVSARADGADSGDEASTAGAFGGGRVAYQSRATDLAGTRHQHQLGHLPRGALHPAASADDHHDRDADDPHDGRPHHTAAADNHHHDRAAPDHH